MFSISDDLNFFICKRPSIHTENNSKKYVNYENNYEETKLEATLNTMCEQYSNTYSNIQIFLYGLRDILIRVLIFVATNVFRYSTNSHTIC